MFVKFEKLLVIEGITKENPIVELDKVEEDDNYYFPYKNGFQLGKISKKSHRMIPCDS